MEFVPSRVTGTAARLQDKVTQENIPEPLIGYASAKCRELIL